MMINKLFITPHSLCYRLYNTYHLTTEVTQPAVEIIKILADYRLPSALFALCYHIYYLVFISISHNILGGMIKLKIVFHSVNLLCITSSPASTYLTLASLM